jgi:hypothetical protein
VIDLDRMPASVEMERPSGSADASSPRQRELEELTAALECLVEVRMLLESRNASAAEVQAHSAEIERLRATSAGLPGW